MLPFLCFGSMKTKLTPLLKLHERHLLTKSACSKLCTTSQSYIRLALVERQALTPQVTTTTVSFFFFFNSGHKGIECCSQRSQPSVMRNSGMLKRDNKQNVSIRLKDQIAPEQPRIASGIQSAVTANSRNP